MDFKSSGPMSVAINLDLDLIPKLEVLRVAIDRARSKLFTFWNPKSNHKIRKIWTMTYRFG